MKENENQNISAIVNKYIKMEKGRYHEYATYEQLHKIFAEIIEQEETCDYIRIIPFFRNVETGLEIELDDRAMMFIQCKNNFTQEEYDDFIEAGKEYDDLVSDPKKRKFYCRLDDKAYFNKCLNIYMEEFDEFLKKEVFVIINEHNLSLETFAYCYMDFEINVD